MTSIVYNLSQTQILVISTVTMDSLVSLMQSIDLISKSIPEGDYLKMCNDMKDIYKVIPRPTSPEAALPATRPVFQPLPQSPVDSEDETDDAVLLMPMNPPRATVDHLGDVARACSEAIRLIKQRESRLRYLKIKQRITAGVRKDAVRERAQQLGVRLREYTIENLRAKGHNVANERSFYKNYLDRQNILTQGIIDDLKDDIEELTSYLEEQSALYNTLHLEVLGRPPVRPFVI
jgi:hypothetical protein